MWKMPQRPLLLTHLLLRTVQVPHRQPNQNLHLRLNIPRPQNRLQRLLLTQPPHPQQCLHTRRFQKILREERLPVYKKQSLPSWRKTVPSPTRCAGMSPTMYTTILSSTGLRASDNKKRGSIRLCRCRLSLCARATAALTKAPSFSQSNKSVPVPSL